MPVFCESAVKVLSSDTIESRNISIGKYLISLKEPGISECKRVQIISNGYSYVHIKLDKEINNRRVYLVDHLNSDGGFRSICDHILLLESSDELKIVIANMKSGLDSNNYSQIYSGLIFANTLIANIFRLTLSATAKDELEQKFGNLYISLTLFCTDKKPRVTDIKKSRGNPRYKDTPISFNSFGKRLHLKIKRKPCNKCYKESELYYKKI